MLTDLELTILSIIAEGQRFGHEIEHVIHERGLHQWVMVGSSSLSYVITKLQHSALIEARPDSPYPLDQRDFDQQHVDQHDFAHTGKHVYTITDAGRGVLQTAIIDRLRTPADRLSMEIALATLRSLKPGQVYGALLRRHAELRGALAGLDAMLADRPQDDPTDLHLAMITHRAAILRAEIEWLDGFMAAWRTRYPAIDDSPDAMDDTSPPHAHTALHSPTHKQDARERAKKLQTLKKPSDDRPT